MTIKEFSKLCNCSTQTLRYYDSIDLLKPARVDKYTGYRYYDEEQAITFVKIKNLQEALFTIEDIKSLLPQNEDCFYKAFEIKIAEQEEKLNKIKQIQRSYRTEYSKMQDTIKKITNAIKESTMEYKPLEEFGIDEKQYALIVERIGSFFEKAIEDKKTKMVFSDIEPEEEKGKNRIQYDSPLTNPEYSIIYECSGWEYAKDVLRNMPALDSSYQYVLHFEVKREKYHDAFSKVALGMVIEKNANENLVLGCNCWESKDENNHFWLFKYIG